MNFNISQLIVLLLIFLFLFSDLKQIYTKIKKELSRKKGT
jgi:hypothetical protein